MYVWLQNVWVWLSIMCYGMRYKMSWNEMSNIMYVRLNNLWVCLNFMSWNEASDIMEWSIIYVSWKKNIMHVRLYNLCLFQYYVMEWGIRYSVYQIMKFVSLIKFHVFWNEALSVMYTRLCILWVWFRIMSWNEISCIMYVRLCIF